MPADDVPLASRDWKKPLCFSELDILFFITTSFFLTVAFQPAMADQANTNLCSSELSRANDCVTADPESCDCFEGDFTKGFPIAVEGAFRDVLAYQNPEDPGFCDASSQKVCQ
jgi:hypothetical protein